MPNESAPALRPDFFGQLAATDPFQGRARRLFERGQVLAVNGNQADLLVGYDQHGNPLELKQVPIVSGYVPRVGDWAAIQYEAGHSGAPCLTGPSMTADVAEDSAGIGVFPVSSSAPTDPQRSTMYFDESLGTWRGWDGGEWVDAFGKLHNALPDLQGGAQGEYYHFSQEAHGALHALWDGEGMASSWIKRLNFRSVDASATQRTRMFEKDGDFYWAINATYDEVADEWNRIDTAKYAYLIALHSEGNIPTEPIGGVAWWRATPGANPIGDWAAVGGWELGYMMTEHRNFVMGGMNLEMDGAGSPPYGRLTQIGSNDASGSVVTAMQRNSWYEGSASWARDSAEENSAIIGFDENADLFVWWYPDSGEGNAPWNTADWQERAKFNLGGGARGRLDIIRSSSETAIGSSAFLAKHKTSSDMVDGFGAGFAFAIEDATSGAQTVGAIYALRDGADNTGKFDFRLASAGSLASRATLNAAGDLQIDGDLQVDGGDIGVSADTDLMQLAANNVLMNAALQLRGGTTRVSNGEVTLDLGSLGSAQSRMIQAGAAASRASFVQFTGDTTPSGYGVWMNFNAYYDDADQWRQPRGDLGSYLFTVNFHKEFAWYYAGAGGADDGVIVPTEIANLSSAGRLQIDGDLQVDGGDIGITADTNLLGLTANELEIRGRCDVTGYYKVDNVQVVTNRQAAIGDVPTGGSAQTAANAQAINSILAAMRTHGLIAR